MPSDGARDCRCLRRRSMDYHRPKSCCRARSAEAGLGRRRRRWKAADPAVRGLRAAFPPGKDEGEMPSLGCGQPLSCYDPGPPPPAHPVSAGRLVQRNPFAAAQRRQRSRCRRMTSCRTLRSWPGSASPPTSVRCLRPLCLSRPSGNCWTTRPTPFRWALLRSRQPPCAFLGQRSQFTASAGGA